MNNLFMTTCQWWFSHNTISMPSLVECKCPTQLRGTPLGFDYLTWVEPSKVNPIVVTPLWVTYMGLPTVLTQFVYLD